MAGSELFTGNNFIMTAASLSKEVKWTYTFKIWIVCFIGNLLGSIFAGYMFYATGLSAGPVGEFISKTSAAKMSIPFLPLLMRGVFCNILVCLATWCSFKLKSESGKLIIIFWCLFAFITSGFEHSVANMTLLTIGLLNLGAASVSIMGYKLNKKDINNIFEDLSKEYLIYAPKLFECEGTYSDTDRVRYGQIETIDDIVFDKKAQYSYKKSINSYL